MTILDLATALLAVILGAYFLSQAESLSARPRRGTALRFSRRGYQALGMLWLAIAALRIVTLVV